MGTLGDLADAAGAVFELWAPVTIDGLGGFGLMRLAKDFGLLDIWSSSTNFWRRVDLLDELPASLSTEDLRLVYEAAAWPAFEAPDGRPCDVLRRAAVLVLIWRGTAGCGGGGGAA